MACSDVAAPSPQIMQVTLHARADEFGDPWLLPPIIVTPECDWGGIYPNCNSDPFPITPYPTADPCAIDPYSWGCPLDPNYTPGAGDGAGGSGGTDGAPSGVDGAAWSEFNPYERALCVSDVARCIMAAPWVLEAKMWARTRTPELGTAESDNRRDALRHTAWQAFFAAHFDAAYAKAWGDAHQQRSFSEKSKYMDLYNNQIGRDLGAYAWEHNPYFNRDSGLDDFIKELVLNAAGNGSLILGLSDPRVPSVGGGGTACPPPAISCW